MCSEMIVPMLLYYASCSHLYIVGIPSTSSCHILLLLLIDPLSPDPPPRPVQAFLTTASISSLSFFRSSATGSSPSTICSSSIHLYSVPGYLTFAPAALSTNQNTNPGLSYQLEWSCTSAGKLTRWVGLENTADPLLVGRESVAMCPVCLLPQRQTRIGKHDSTLDSWTSITWPPTARMLHSRKSDPPCGRLGTIQNLRYPSVILRQ